jgi:hypothetical protein
MLGLKPLESAKLGMAMGACNCMVEGPVMQNPIEEIKKLDPELAYKVISAAERLGTVDKGVGF